MQGFNRGQGCTKRRILNGLCFETRKRLLAVRGGVNDYQHSASVKIEQSPLPFLSTSGSSFTNDITLDGTAGIIPQSTTI
ncbi:MAG: hypothetical protein U9Q89_07980, partial [Thermodesulfobacteriota bacterium]|nr:hypothetical protein [Thermodesulfobacteriota bacterium]